MSVGNDAVFSVREVDNRGTLCFLLAATMVGGRIRSFIVRVAEPQLLRREVIVSPTR